MTTYEIKLYNEETRQYQFLTAILAENKENAIQKFIKMSNYVKRPGFRLFVKSPGCL